MCVSDLALELIQSGKLGYILFGMMAGAYQNCIENALFLFSGSNVFSDKFPLSTSLIIIRLFDRQNLNI